MNVSQRIPSIKVKNQHSYQKNVDNDAKIFFT